jgi:chloramphenicol-sensitive protein RarD
VTENENKNYIIGLLSTAAAYFLWGMLPIYWKLIKHVSSWEILTHRIIWSFFFTFLFLLIMGKAKDLYRIGIGLKNDKKELIAVLAASMFISINWVTYIVAVNTDHILQASLGYYINPLVSVLLGIIVLKEKMKFWQIVSFAFAASGVLYLSISYGEVPYIALLLAFSFGFYGLAKKFFKMGALVGLALETLFVLPIALIYMGFLGSTNTGAFLTEGFTTLILIGAGIITALPLLFFAKGAKQIPLFMIGFLQYIAPTINLFIGVFFYKEAFTSAHAVAFTLIWTALVLFSFSNTKLFQKYTPAAFTKKNNQLSN